MLKTALIISLGLHGFFFAMLSYCPTGIRVGATRGGGGEVSVELLETKTAAPQLVVSSKTGLIKTHKAKKQKVKPKKTTVVAAKKTSKFTRKTLLTETRPGPGFDLRNIKSSLSPAMQRLFSRLRRDIELNKHIPRKAKRFKQRGEVAMKFNISKDGKITKVVVATPSPFNTLNQSATAAIEALQKKRYPLPKEYADRDDIQVILPIRYRL